MKLISFILAAFMTAVHVGDVMFAAPSAQPAQAAVLLLSVLICLVFYCQARRPILDDPERIHSFAAFFQIVIGSAAIVYGLPAFVYVPYTLLRRNDGKPGRGTEFNGTVGVMIVLVALIRIAVLFEILPDALRLLPLLIAMFGAWYAEKRRIEEYDSNR